MIKINQKAIRKILLVITILGVLALQTDFFADEVSVTGYIVDSNEIVYHPTPGNVPFEGNKKESYSPDPYN